VLIDDAPARSCIVYAVACQGAAVTTIEGLDDDEVVRELRPAFSREHALQCGYCTPGMLISARDLVQRAEVGDEQPIRLAMSGNLCRCTGYVGIIRAIESVIRDRRGRGIAAVRGGGRLVLGPVGSGHAHQNAVAEVKVRVPSALDDGTAPAAMSPGSSGLWSPAEPAAELKPQVSFEQSFVVRHPICEVWAFFGRVPDVAACLPGVSLTGAPRERNVAGKMRMKVGPISAEFEGSAEIDRNPATRSGTIRGSGRDARGGSTTRGLIDYRLVRIDDRSTRVDLAIGYTLTGPLAQFGRSDLVRDIAKRVIDAFAQNLEARLARPDEVAPPVAELKAGSLLFSVLGGRMATWLRRLLGR
jgi:carbon-monoxide dehydrogenase small subunit